MLEYSPRQPDSSRNPASPLLACDSIFYLVYHWIKDKVGKDEPQIAIQYTQSFATTEEVGGIRSHVLRPIDPDALLNALKYFVLNIKRVIQFHKISLYEASETGTGNLSKNCIASVLASVSVFYCLLALSNIHQIFSPFFFSFFFFFLQGLLFH